MPVSAWKQAVSASWRESSKDNIGIVAAGVAFYGLLALVPLLAAIVLTYGLLADPMTVIGNVKSLTSLLPQDAAKLIGDQIMSVVQTSGSKKGTGLLIAIAIALFGARNASGSLVIALNIAYDEEDRRGFVKANLLALAITLGAAAGAVVALAAIAILGYLEKLLPHLPPIFAILGKIGSYAVLIFAGAAGAATLYRYGPDRKEAEWEWITPGSIFSAVAWVVLTLGFGFYVANFANYNKTYGSLATVVILITWMYLSAYAFLFGAELNSDLERKTERETTEAGPVEADPGCAQDLEDSKEPSPSETAISLRTSEIEQQAPDHVLRPANSRVRNYLAGRMINRAGALVGMEKVGMVSAILASLGLSLMRKRGRGLAGGTLVATAVAVSFLKRRD